MRRKSWFIHEGRKGENTPLPNVHVCNRWLIFVVRLLELFGQCAFSAIVKEELEGRKARAPKIAVQIMHLTKTIPFSWGRSILPLRKRVIFYLNCPRTPYVPVVVLATTVKKAGVGCFAAYHGLLLLLRVKVVLGWPNLENKNLFRSWGGEAYICNFILYWFVYFSLLNVIARRWRFRKIMLDYAPLNRFLKGGIFRLKLFVRTLYT